MHPMLRPLPTNTQGPREQFRRDVSREAKRATVSRRIEVEYWQEERVVVSLSALRLLARLLLLGRPLIIVIPIRHRSVRIIIRRLRRRAPIVIRVRLEVLILL